MLGAISNILVIILIFTTVLIFTLPNHIIDKIPLVPEIKNFLQKTFSQSYDLGKTIFTTIFNAVYEAGLKLKNATTEGYSTTRDTAETKYEAAKDLEDAWNRLTE